MKGRAVGCCKIVAWMIVVVVVVVAAVVVVAVSRFKNHGPSAGQVLLDLTSSTTDIYSLAGPPATAVPPRTPGVLLLSHCRQTPVYQHNGIA